MGTYSNGSGRVKTARRVFDIVELVSDSDGVSTLEVADELDVAKSTAHGYLLTLEEQGWLVRDDERFRLGSTFLKYGRLTREQHGVLETIEPTLEWCADRTEETVWYTAEEQGTAVYLEKKTGSRAARTNGEIGKRAPLHASACGKAILAAQPDSRLEELTLAAYTPATITSHERLREEIEAVRNSGVAYNDGETTSGLRAVACPIRHEGHVVGAISVSGPEKRFTDDRYRERLPALLGGAANEIELNLSDRSF